MNPTYEEQVRNINSVKSTSPEEKAMAISYLKNPIPLKSLENTSETTLPTKRTETTTFPELTPLQAEEKRIQDTATQSDKEYKKALEDIGVVEAKEREYAEELGATKSRQEYKKYSDELTREKRNLENEVRRLEENPEGMSVAGLRSTIDDIERKSLQKQADFAILGNMALGNYNEALSIAKDKVDSELKPLTRQLEYIKDVRETNKDLLTTAQKAKLNSLYSDVERQKNKEEERLTKIESIKIEAIKNGFRGDFSGVQTVEEAARKAGNFLVTPMERLQMEKLKGDIAINAAELALAKQTIQGTTGDPIADIIAGSSRYDDKRLTDSQLEKIQKSLSALGSMETLQGLLSQGKDGIDVSGPVKGRLRTLITQFGGDANASAINATIQGLIPTVARGIFGEVGVLTDADIANYRKTVPNLNATGEQNKLISLVMYDVLSRSLKNTLVSNARNQTNVSGFLSDYQDVESRINTLKSNLGVVEVAKIDPVNKAKMESAWSATNINNKVKSTLDSFFN